MKELESLIIGSCFGEDKYKYVSFLEPEDFTNYHNKPYRYYFKLLKKANVENLTLSECIIQTKDERLRALLVSEVHSLGANYPDRLALKLLECRFKTLLMDLLNHLSFKTKKAAERDLLMEALVVASEFKTDVFDLSDNLIEYLGAHASDYTKVRLNSFISYRDKRAANAKKVINELR